ncbi:uncharacterized protein LOC120350282 [Nilaparvata lugens]|uniref:uncharacterized protein LOC120350282 n=1 Tax=Nilaparvata lugens TaxID=108931 RepID=UPI00193CEFCC|nr:uncharacterized protein LOC120350282 [Nilaparvata lugens]
MTVTNIYIMEVITHVSRLNLQIGTDVHKYVTRQADNYVLPRHRTAIFEDKPSYVGRKLWNHLPEKIKRLDCVTLKKRLSEFLKGRPMINGLKPKNNSIDLKCWQDYLQKCYPPRTDCTTWDVLDVLHPFFDAPFSLVLQDFYRKATVRMSAASGYTEEVPIAQGVMQGDTISPILFAIFINDMEDYFVKKECNYVSINERAGLNLLSYADDSVLLSNTRVDAQKKLNVLQEYCHLNKLVVNVSKTKVLIFKKSHGRARRETLYYENNPLETVSTIRYLGVVFSNSGLFHQAAKDMKRKAASASGCVQRIVVDSRCSASWSSRAKLFDAMVRSVLLYSSELWALRYWQQLEVIQTKFIKSSFYWPIRTPGYVVRLETGRHHLVYNIFKSAFNWWLRILNMCDNRAPKMCFRRLLATDANENKKYNWASQMKEFFEDIGYGHIWAQQDGQVAKVHKTEIFKSFRQKLYNLDAAAAINSPLRVAYHQFTTYDIAPYLESNLPHYKVRLFSQIRISMHTEAIVI